MSSGIAAIAGRDDGSLISTEEREFLFVQSRSAFVYGTSGLISKRSAPIADARLRARDAVTPLAEKYATSFLLMTSSFPPPAGGIK